MSESTVNPAHPEVELISEHLEGLLDAPESAELTAHLRDCPECRETHDALLELQQLLHAEADPGPMPEDVAARIDAALAEARDATDDAEAGTGTEIGIETGTGSGTDAGLPRSSRRPADNRPAGRSRGRIRFRRVLTALAVVVAAGGIGLAVSSGGDIDGAASSTSAGGADARSSAPLFSGTSPTYEFTSAGLNAQIQQLVRNDALSRSAQTALGTAAVPSTTPSPANHGASTSAPNAGKEAPVLGPQAPPCVLAATNKSALPQIQGLGHFLGVQVFALVYPDPADPRQWDVYLVQDSCASPVVLFHQLVPRA